MARKLALCLLALALPAGAGATSIDVTDGSVDDWDGVTSFVDPEEGSSSDIAALMITADHDAEELYLRVDLSATQLLTFYSFKLTFPDGSGQTVTWLEGGKPRISNCTRNCTLAYGKGNTDAGDKYYEILVPYAKLRSAFADNDYVLEMSFTSVAWLTGVAIDSAPDDDTITYDATTDVATPVQILAQAAEVVAGGVVVSWVTGAEVRNAGFRVWKRGRAVTDHVAAAGTPGTGASYEIFDAGGRAGDVYRIEDIDEGGARTWHEAVIAQRGPAGARVHALAAVQNAIPQPAAARQVPVRELAEVARLGTGEQGIYEIDPAALIAAGIDPEVAVSRNLDLTYQGRPVQLHVAGGRLLFPAVQPASTYDGVAAYRLAGRGVGPATPLRRLQPSRGRPERSFRSHVRAGEDQVYDWYVGGDDAYAWRLVRPSSRGVVALPLPDPVSGGDATVVVHLHGGKPFGHAYDIVLNGTVLGTASWEERTPFTAVLSAPADVLDPGGDNVLEVRATAATTAADYVYLHDVEVDYDRAYRARDGELDFSAMGGSTVRVSGFDEARIVLFDVTEPDSPRLLATSPSRDGARGFALTFRDTAPGLRRYRAATLSRLRSPTVRPAQERLASGRQGADMLIVTTKELAPEVAPLVDLRRSQGLTVEVVTVEEAYDAHGHGQAGPDAIRALVQDAVSSWAPSPQYLLLAGQGSMDPRGLLAHADREQVPAHFEVTREFHLREPSDVWYALDGRKVKLAVGRIPASTPGELSAAVEKIVAREEAPGTGRTLLIADGPQDGTAFAHTADRLERALAGHELSRLDVDGAADAPGQIDRALDEVDLIAFAGHSWIGGFGWSGNLLSADAETRQRARAPIAITSTCWVGNYSDSRGIALASRTVLAAGSGLSASFAPTSMLNLSDHGILVADVLAAAAAGEPTLGDAVRAGQQAWLDRGADRLDSLHGYALIGDPAARSPLVTIAPPR